MITTIATVFDPGLNSPEMYEKFYRREWLGMEGNPPTRQNSSP